MAEHNKLGNRGEEAALGFLANAGYRILEKNWRFGKAEIDIIAQKEDVLAIVEVKTRGSDLFERAEETVNQHKIKRIVEAANHYIESQDLDVEVRFDIIGIQKKGESWEVTHLEAAFENYF